MIKYVIRNKVSNNYVRDIWHYPFKIDFTDDIERAYLYRTELDCEVEMKTLPPHYEIVHVAVSIEEIKI